MNDSSNSSREWIEEVVAEFLARRTGAPDIARDLHLFESGLINSLFAIELLTFLESRFGVKVTSADLDLSRFATIERVGAFVAEKQQAR